eukprot:6181404-Amphidinium_carterae.1
MEERNLGRAFPNRFCSFSFPPLFSPSKKVPKGFVQQTLTQDWFPKKLNISFLGAHFGKHEDKRHEHHEHHAHFLGSKTN